jgi:hypothetical protein
MPSRSPVAEVDQRLNIDAFAQHLASRHAAPSVAEEIEAPERVHETGIVPEAASTRTRRKRSAARRAGAAHEIEAERTAAQPRPMHPIPKAAPMDAASARGEAITKRRRATPAIRESTEAVARERPGDSHRASAEPSRRAPALSSAEIVGETRTAARARPDDARERARRDPPPASLEPSMKSVLDAVKRATSWIEAGERRERSRETAPLRPAAPAPPSRAHGRRPAPVTHLEIGRIEVEVVAPAKPAAPASRPHATAATSGSPAASRPFGWRQR